MNIRQQRRLVPAAVQAPSSLQFGVAQDVQAHRFLTKQGSTVSGGLVKSMVKCNFFWCTSCLMAVWMPAVGSLDVKYPTCSHDFEHELCVTNSPSCKKRGLLTWITRVVLMDGTQHQGVHLSQGRLLGVRVMMLR